jgi:hypothetical protein
MGIQRMSNDKLASLQRIDRSLLARLAVLIRTLVPKFFLTDWPAS